MTGALVGDWLLHVLTRVAAIEVAFKESRAEAYDLRADVPSYVMNPDHAEFLFKLQREDSTHTDEKVKQLLALSSSLATVLLAFARDVRPRSVVVAILALLVCTVFLCLSVLGVRTEQFPTPEDAEDETEPNSWARDLLVSSKVNAAAHAFRVDRYRAAGRYFRLALLLTPIAAIFTVAKPDQAVRVETAIDSVAGNIAHVERLIDSLQTRGAAARALGPVLVAPAPGSTWFTGQPVGGASNAKKQRDQGMRRDSI